MFKNPKMKTTLIVITYTLVLLMALYNFKAVTGTLGMLLGLIMPFIYGLAIAYVLNMPYLFFKTKVFHKAGKNGKWIDPVSIVSAYISVLIGTALIVWFIIPQLGSSVSLLVNNIPSYLDSLEKLANKLIADLNLGSLLGDQIGSRWASLLQNAASILSDVLQGVLTYALGMTSSLYNWFIGFTFSIYMLIGKDKLLAQLKKLIRAYLPERWVDSIFEVSTLTNGIFNGFIKGSLIDSLVVGVLCFIGLSVLGVPYALLISVIQGVTNIIPVFGPFIGAVPSTFIILMDDPIKALVFVVFIVVLQQIDGNIIQPRIVGNTIGLPGIWVLLAIVIGSGLFGIIGLIIGVPAFAVLYAILKKSVNHRLMKKTNDSR